MTRDAIQSNVNALEVAKFSDMAKAAWDENGPWQPLHRLNPLRSNYIAQHSGPLLGQHVLDVGCGGGILTEALAKQGAYMIGIDASQAAIEIAIAHAQTTALDITYRHITADALLNESMRFDVITAMEILEHVPDPGALIKTLSQLIKPGGRLFFSTINRHPKAFWSAIVGAEYLLQWLPRGTHHYAEFIRPSELVAWAHHTNCSLIDLTGVTYQFSKKQFITSADTRINYMACFERL